MRLPTLFFMLQSLAFDYRTSRLFLNLILMVLNFSWCNMRSAVQGGSNFYRVCMCLRWAWNPESWQIKWKWLQMSTWFLWWCWLLWIIISCVILFAIYFWMNPLSEYNLTNTPFLNDFICDHELPFSYVCISTFRFKVFHRLTWSVFQVYFATMMFRSKSRRKTIPFDDKLTFSNWFAEKQEFISLKACIVIVPESRVYIFQKSENFYKNSRHGSNT